MTISLARHCSQGFHFGPRFHATRFGAISCTRSASLRESGKRRWKTKVTEYHGSGGQDLPRRFVLDTTAQFERRRSALLAYQLKDGAREKGPDLFPFPEEIRERTGAVPRF